jgi:hypothetical protein
MLAFLQTFIVKRYKLENHGVEIVEEDSKEVPNIVWRRPARLL